MNFPFKPKTSLALLLSFLLFTTTQNFILGSALTNHSWREQRGSGGTKWGEEFSQKWEPQREAPQKPFVTACIIYVFNFFASLITCISMVFNILVLQKGQSLAKITKDAIWNGQSEFWLKVAGLDKSVLLETKLQQSEGYQHDSFLLIN